MRLHEISDDIRIESKLLNYFEVDESSDNYIIKNGIVDFISNVYKLKKSVPKLPIMFNKVGGSFNCAMNYLTTLEGSPKIINESFYCGFNLLTSLEGGPIHVGEDYKCDGNNELNSLDGLPQTIGKGLYLGYRKDLPMLKILGVRNLKKLYLKSIYINDEPLITPINDIINKYLGQGRIGVLQCAAELTRAGFKGNARL